MEFISSMKMKILMVVTHPYNHINRKPITKVKASVSITYVQWNNLSDT